ncbi:MAG: hypothetical protein R3B13_26455 [Polyangiaceae bacterium]
MESGPNTTTRSANELLQALELILAEEHRALRKLDSAAIEKVAAQKVDLEVELANAGPLTPTDKDLAQRVRRAALANQILLVHARDTVRGLVAAMTGTQPTAHPLARQSTAPARLNVKV